MQLKRLPAVGAYSASLLFSLIGGAFWLQYVAGFTTVTTLSNAIMFSVLTATMTTLGYVFEKGADRW